MPDARATEPDARAKRVRAGVKDTDPRVFLFLSDYLQSEDKGCFISFLCNIHIHSRLLRSGSKRKFKRFLYSFDYLQFSYLLKEKNVLSVLSLSPTVKSLKQSSAVQNLFLAVITTKVITLKVGKEVGYLKMQIKWGCWNSVIRIFRYSFATHTVVFHVLIVVRIVSQSCCVTCTVMEMMCSLPQSTKHVSFIT